ncbi:ribosome silencing factor [Penaeicola halotolerans]|uniref:ribosome silencing factor n=1 Tax=Penaeicola halotolerans TaxID=2793196 RepID=UPI001CF86ADB|nr:ribosome silencing factor [Penaeicola halotolerans]
MKKTKPEGSLSADKLCDLVVKGMEEKKAHDIVVMDLRKVKHAVADFFVLCSGNSDSQIDAIADSIEDEVYKVANERPWHKEGKANKEWILIDFANVVAHVFKKDKREFFALEELWGDAKFTNVAN